MRATQSLLGHRVTRVNDVKPLAPLDATVYREPQRRRVTGRRDHIPVAVGGVAGASIALTGRYWLAVAVTVVWLVGMYASRARRRPHR